MRRVGRLTARARANERRPPEPRWRRRLKTGAMGLLILTLPAGIVAAARQPLVQAAAGRLSSEVIEGSSTALGMTVVDVLAVGREATSEAALAEAVAPFIGASMLTLDPERVRAKLTGLPWVKDVTVTKLLPGTLFLKLAEHQAVALWHDQGRTMLVGKDGSLLPIKDVRPFAALKLLHGKGAPAAAGELLELLAVAPSLARRVTAAARIGERRWNLYLDGRLEVRLPEQDAATAWQRFVEIERAGEITTRSVEAVDLRGPSWTAIKLKGEPADIILGRGA